MLHVKQTLFGTFLLSKLAIVKNASRVKPILVGKYLTKLIDKLAYTNL